jgi:hypothetical protein
MPVGKDEVPKARRCKLQRHKALSMDACDVLGDGSMSSGYPSTPVMRAVYMYTVSILLSYTTLCVILK